MAKTIQYSSISDSAALDEIFKSALDEPVFVTGNRGRNFVVMSRDFYSRIISGDVAEAQAIIESFYAERPVAFEGQGAQ